MVLDKKGLLVPLLVIQTLAHNSTATLSAVKVVECQLREYNNKQNT